MEKPFGEQLERLIFALIPIFLQFFLLRLVPLIYIGVFRNLRRKMHRTRTCPRPHLFLFRRFQLLSKVPVFPVKLLTYSCVLVLIGIFPLARIFVRFVKQENDPIEDFVPLLMAGIINPNGP